MSKFPTKAKIKLARDSKLENTTVAISGNKSQGFVAKIGSSSWKFPATSSTCSLLGGRDPQHKNQTLEITGSCKKSPKGIFSYLIAVTRDANHPPDDHVVEWVAEDEG